ncbi:MAG TPA: 30S ribosomal protein S8 [Alphaproteobacteria bacterium]
MTMSDPISDMLARIRNGQKAGMPAITMPASGHKAAVLEVLVREGFIRGYKEAGKGAEREITVELKYDQGQPMIKEIKRISTPGRRIYRKQQELPRFYNGLGIAIVSTSRGVMSDHEARAQNVGGEVLCQVF